MLVFAPSRREIVLERIHVGRKLGNASEHEQKQEV